MSWSLVQCLQRGYDLPSRLRKPGKIPIVSSAGPYDFHDIYQVKHPGVVTGRYGTIGEVFYIEEDFWPLNTTLYVSDFKGNNPLYISYLFRTVDFASHSGKSGVPGINRNDIHELKVLRPPVKEQIAIANALSDVDALITSLEKLITKKRTIKTAAMQQLLTGKKRLPGFEGDWSIISMNTDASLKARIGWQALTTNEYLDQGDFYLVTGTDFKGGRVDWSTCHYVDECRYSQDRNIQLQNGDVLLTKDGTIGKVGYVDKLDAPATLNSGVFVIRPVKESFYPLFLFYILSSRIFDNFLNRITAGSTITHLYQKDFVTFEFFAPSLTEQEAISDILSTMDDEIELLQYRLNKSQQLKQGMMQELLTGRTRLL